MRKIFCVFLCAGVLSFISFFAFLRFSNDELARQLKIWNVGMDLAEFALTDFSKEQIRTLTKEELAAERGETTVKLTRIETEAREKYIEDKKFLFESLFLPTTSPYPGVITNVIECPEEFKPKLTKTEKGTFYALFAGERLNWGICAEDLIEYYSTFGIFDCEEKGIFEVRAFSKAKHEAETIVRSFTC